MKIRTENSKEKPTIRFKSYIDDWTKKKFYELIELQSGKDYKHLERGDIPVYGTGGYMLSVNKALSYTDDAIGIGRKGTIDKPYILRAPFWTVDTLFYSLPKNKIDLDFLYLCFQSINWKNKDESTGVPSLSKKAINATEIKIPNNTDEQLNLGNFFSILDTLINNTQKELDKLFFIKKSMLQKMFPQDGKLIPEIRFKGFSGNWEEKKIGDICKDNLIPIPTPTTEYMRLGIRSHAKGTFHEKVNAGNGLDVDTMYVVEENNLIVNITFAWEHAVAITDENDAGKLVSHRFPQFKFLENQCPLFYKYSILDNKFREKLDVASPGGAGRNRVLNIKQFKKITRIVPKDFEEQQKIGLYFQNLDNIINEKQIELEKLKNIKKSLLSKMLI